MNEYGGVTERESCGFLSLVCRGAKDKFLKLRYRLQMRVLVCSAEKIEVDSLGALDCRPLAFSDGAA